MSSAEQHHFVSYMTSVASPHVLPDHSVYTMSEAKRDYQSVSTSPYIS